MESKRYPTDLSDDEWRCIRPHLPDPAGQGRPRLQGLRAILFVPSRLASELSGENPYLDIKYPFAQGESRWRYRDLIVRMLGRLSRLHATSG